MTPVDRSSITLHLPDAEATLALGARIAGVLRPGLVIALRGDLGAGKTTLVRGMLRALGVSGAVKSPTYTLVEHYRTSSLYFYHFDFYRVDNPDEWETGGFAEYFRADAVCVVEWPERVHPHLPPADLAISLAYPADADAAGRDVTVLALTPAGHSCLSAARGVP